MQNNGNFSGYFLLECLVTLMVLSLSLYGIGAFWGTIARTGRQTIELLAITNVLATKISAGDSQGLKQMRVAEIANHHMNPEIIAGSLSVVVPCTLQEMKCKVTSNSELPINVSVVYFKET